MGENVQQTLADGKEKSVESFTALLLISCLKKQER
jgi:hypothetical protein